VALDTLKFHPGCPCPTLLRPTDGPPLKRLLPLWTPHTIHADNHLIKYLDFANEPTGVIAVVVAERVVASVLAQDADRQASLKRIVISGKPTGPRTLPALPSRVEWKRRSI
jgi:hypothetical protein